MILPESLKPTAEEEISLLSGEKVAIPKASISFDAKTGDVIPDTYGCEAVLDINGAVEPAILRILQADAWSGCWIDIFGKTRATIDSYEVVAEERDVLLQKFQGEVGANSGCFDVFAWDGNDVLFVQTKRAGKENRDTPTKWLQAALEIGFKPDNFLIVEWEMDGIPF